MNLETALGLARTLLSNKDAEFYDVEIQDVAEKGKTPDYEVTLLHEELGNDQLVIATGGAHMSSNILVRLEKGRIIYFTEGDTK